MAAGGLKEEAKVDKNDFDKEVALTAGDIMMSLNMLGEEKYNKSEFMTFCKGLNKGALKLREEGLQEDAGKLE